MSSYFSRDQQVRTHLRDFPVVQWLRTYFLMQGMPARSLVEKLRSHVLGGVLVEVGTEPSHHYWAQAPQQRACLPTAPKTRCSQEINK